MLSVMLFNLLYLVGIIIFIFFSSSSCQWWWWYFKVDILSCHSVVREFRLVLLVVFTLLAILHGSSRGEIQLCGGAFVVRWVVESIPHG